MMRADAMQADISPADADSIPKRRLRPPSFKPLGATKAC
jgi:hypothetical protein